MLQSLRRHPLRLKIILFGVIVCSVAGYLMFRSPMKEVTPDANLFPIRGVDISAHNDVQNWKMLADSIDFILIKATEGGNWNDRNFNRNYKEASDAGLKVGAYHFFRFDRDGVVQGINFYNSLWNKDFYFPAIIDVEETGNPGGISKNDITKRLKDMVAYLEKNNVKVMFYSNKKGYDEYIKPYFPNYPLWICSLSSVPDMNLPWIIWQFSHSGNVPGINREVDLNVLRIKEFY